ncbi:hypothetical protein GZ212_15415 [Mangrovimonas sp. CR14]|uniref:DUF6705 family protein n=1 Tax=Mangrovimonas sp. CR14 TaxID=2706120 RepID=UPI001420372A|nr:DUF6705 family protein [Mangrovimonas sp. CR14]NIK93548.1 hypothetical protein [Mangrovimonas sp. CR14]
MKVLLLFLGILICLSCKAQTIIVPIGSGADFEDNQDYYIKDVNNEFEKFVGTWQYQNGNSYITSKLKENEHYQISNNKKYVDLLVGEYQYVENGVEKVNTLLDFDDPAIMGYKHSINGRVIVHQLPNYCLDNSDPSEVKIELIIHHPTDEYAQGRLILRYLNDNGVEKLEACIYDYSILGDGSVSLDIPDGNYVFIKH